MSRNKLGFEKLRDVHDERIEQRQSSKDISIIQLFNRESKAQREKQSKIIEIQKGARRKDDSNRRLQELHERATKIRKNSQTTTGLNIVRLPPIESPARPTIAIQGLRKRVGVMKPMKNELLLPNIHTSKALLNSPAFRRHRDPEPSRDPRFQSLISVLLTSGGHFGDLQRFAPPKKESNRLSRVGLGF